MYALWILFRDFKNHILQGKTSYAGTSYPGSTVYLSILSRHVQSKYPSSRSTFPLCTTQWTGSAVKILSGKAKTLLLDVR